MPKSREDESVPVRSREHRYVWNSRSHRHRTAPPGHRQRVMNMNARLVHRGPDGQGAFHQGPVALAMRRLSIIDLEGGQQPLFNEDRSVVLVANGEIYNHVELRAQLRSQGHRFKSGSDCEVIVHLYEEYGPDCVKHLRGMFAFALWDWPSATSDAGTRSDGGKAAIPLP